MIHFLGVMHYCSKWCLWPSKEPLGSANYPPASQYPTSGTFRGPRESGKLPSLASWVTLTEISSSESSNKKGIRTLLSNQEFGGKWTPRSPKEQEGNYMLTTTADINELGRASPQMKLIRKFRGKGRQWEINAVNFIKEESHFKPRKRGSLGGAAVWRLPLAHPGRDPGDPGSNPTSGSRCMEPASPSACVSASLFLSLSLRLS